MSFMHDEIFSEPTVLKRTVQNCAVVADIKKEFAKRNIRQIKIMARGTSSHAGIVFSYLCPLYTGIFADNFFPSLSTVYDRMPDMTDTCLLVVSQSGKSVDTVTVTEDAKKKGALIVAVTNDDGCPIAKIADYHLFLDVDEEKSVAATKTYIAELFALTMLANGLSKDSFFDADQAVEGVNRILSLSDDVARAAAFVRDADKIITLTRGSMLGTGKEFALKMTECCYIYGLSWSTADFMHGPLSLADESCYAVLLAPSGQFTEEYKEVATKLNGLGVRLTVFSDIPDVLALGKVAVKMPVCSEAEAPIYYGVCAALYAMHIATMRGRNVDAPRNLKKVTVTK